MTDEANRSPRNPADQTNIDRYLIPDTENHFNTQEVNVVLSQIPLTLQPFFKEEVDLNRELVRRFPNMPLVSTIRFRDLYGSGERKVATLSTQDGAASLIVDVSHDTPIQFSFMLGSMLALRFQLDELSDLDRRAWLENMENRVEEVVFLWGKSRWQKDYIISVPHPYYVSLLAFSANNFEAAVRITPTASQSLFKWLREFWYPESDGDDDDSTDSSNPAVFASW